MVVIILQGINPFTHNDTSFPQSGRLCKYVIGSESLCAYQMPPNKSRIGRLPPWCGSKTCKILIIDNSFSSNFTKRSFTTHSFDNLSCKPTNLVYGIECGLCGLIYVGETKGQLRSRMNGHRFQINYGGNQLLYRHFNLPDHSIMSMKFRILEKIYRTTNNPYLSTSFRRKREEHWIRKLGTAAPYGCNDHIDSIGNLTRPGCQSVNVLNLFDRTRGDIESMARGNIISLRYMMFRSMGSCRSSIYS